VVERILYRGTDATEETFMPEKRNVVIRSGSKEFVRLAIHV
jgi:hypothetical protein